MQSNTSSEDPDSSSLKDFVAPRALNVRTCSAAGTKVFDANANGTRDDGEPGIPGFIVWADYNNNGVQDADEPYSPTDAAGNYVIFDIQPPENRPYRLRERLANANDPFAGQWVCSHPSTTVDNGAFPCASEEIDAAATPSAEGQDFGNWLPARLTLRKDIFPPDDLGRFDLQVHNEANQLVGELPQAGDGATTTVSPLRP